MPTKYSCATIAEFISEVQVKLDPLQWNSLILVYLTTRTTTLKEIMDPFSSNPDVKFVLDGENQSLKFTGKRVAVEHACDFLMKHLNKELPIDR